jgi:hypothetical protein
MMRILKQSEFYKLNENINTSFEIPKEIEQLYQISGDFSNTKNWKAKVILVMF